MSREILQELASQVTIDDMPNGDMRMVAEFCGVDIAIQLMSQMGGLTIYIPTGMYKTKIEQYVRKNYRKMEIKRMALALNVSEKFIYGLIRRAKEEEAQVALFQEK